MLSCVTSLWASGCLVRVALRLPATGSHCAVPGPDTGYPLGCVFFPRHTLVGVGFKTRAWLSIYAAKKRAPWPLAYLSISQKNGRLTFFFNFFYYEGKMVCSARFHPGWVMGGCTGVLFEKIAGNSPEMASVCFFLKKNGIRPSLSIYLSKKQAPLPVAYLSMSKKSERLWALVPYLRKKNATLGGKGLLFFWDLGSGTK